MRLLLDTHALIWWAEDQPIAEAAAAAIQSPRNKLEGLTIVTRAPVFDRYPVAVLRA